MTFQTKSTLTIVFALSSAACGGSGSSVDEHLLTCQVGDTVREYCIPRPGACYLGAAINECSWNWYGELGQNEQFSAATLSDDPVTCPTGALEGILAPNPKNTEDCGGAPPNSSATAGGSSATGGGSTSTGGGSTSGDPACEDPTGGAQDTYLCSLLSPTKCVDISPDNHLESEFGADPWPMDPVLDVCWAPIESDPLPAKQISKCQDAASTNDARLACQQDCDAFNKEVVKQCALKGCTVVKEVDCVLDGNVDGEPDAFEGPHEATGECNSWRCPDGFDMLPAWDGSSEFAHFTGSGSMIMNDGHVAGMSSIRGYIGFSLTNCTLSSCDVTVDALEGLTRYAQGGYTDAAGGGGTYEIENMGFRGRTAFSGTWDKARDTVSFPTAVIQAQFWASNVYIDGLPLPYGFEVIEINQVVGSLSSETGPLTLNLSYNLGFGTISVSLTSE